MKNSNGTNGHANGNGVAHKPASPDDRVARAEAHARGQARLRDDALVQLDRAAAARAAAEKSHGDAVEVHATALRASGAKPTDDALLDAVSRAAARVSRERGALDLAVRGHEHCTARATTAEGAVRAAERALECARMQAALQRPERLGGMVHAGRVIVAAVAALRSAAAAARDLVVADHELVRSARGRSELPPTVPTGSRSPSGSPRPSSTRAGTFPFRRTICVGPCRRSRPMGRCPRSMWLSARS